MEKTGKPFSPEQHEASRRIKELTPQSSEAEIKDAFIKWNREVLGPMFDDIIKVLEAAYRPYAKLKIIPDQETDNAKNYIFRAIETLKVHRAVHCEMADAMAGATTRSQFLTLMGIVDLEVNHGEWFPISYGMKDAKIGNRYHGELFPAILFRVEEARRIAEGCLDMSYFDVLQQQWFEYEKQTNVKNLDNLGTANPKNAKILYGYFNTVLHPLICKIFAMDKEQESNWCNVFEDISPNRGEVPDLDVLLNGLKRWRSRVEGYLDSLPENVKADPNYEPARQELFKYIDILEPYLLKLQTAEEVNSTEVLKK